MVMIWQIATNALGPDPAEPLMQGTGEWALRLLVLVLLARPASRLGWSLLFRHRRMLGLFTFFYATVHLLLFAQVYIAWSAPILVEELAERPYVIVGASAWLLLLPLAITSTDAMRRTLKQRWRQLHRLAYGVAVLGVLHLLWLSRSDIGTPLVYGGIFAVLLLWRLVVFLQRRRSVLT